MIKMIDVLGRNLIQHFSHALYASHEQFDKQLDQSILSASDIELNDAITTFFNEVDAFETAQALDISIDHIQALQLGLSLKSSEYLTDIKKIAMLCFALETNAIAELEIADSLHDYPI